MEGQSKGSRGLEAYCKEGQGPPRAVAPSEKNFSDFEVLMCAHALLLLVAPKPAKLTEKISDLKMRFLLSQVEIFSRLSVFSYKRSVFGICGWRVVVNNCLVQSE